MRRRLFWRIAAVDARDKGLWAVCDRQSRRPIPSKPGVLVVAEALAGPRRDLVPEAIVSAAPTA
jgi:hypothetical protein